MACSSATVIFSSQIKEVYNPKTFFLHAASLGQAFAHCPIFPTAASRRSLDRFSVPMRPFDLSVRLPIVGLVSRYLANCLIGREPISDRVSPLPTERCHSVELCGISTGFPVLFHCLRQVAHVLLARPPLCYARHSVFESSLVFVSVFFALLASTHYSPLLLTSRSARHNTVRLECVMHAASVHPEPGSNSLKFYRIYLLSQAYPLQS